MQFDRWFKQHCSGIVLDHAKLYLVPVIIAGLIWSAYAVTNTFTITISSILPAYNDASTNWRLAGLQSVGGIPTRNTVCATLSPSGGGSDTSAINTAIASCPAGDVLMLAAGTFKMLENEWLTLNKGITLRGTGSCNNVSTPYCQTVIVVTNGAARYLTGNQCTTGTNGLGGTPAACPTLQSSVFMGANGKFQQYWSGCLPGPGGTATCAAAIPLAVDAAQGATTVQVSSTTNFTVGMWVLIDEASAGAYVTDPLSTSLGQVWATSDALNSSGSPATGRVVWEKHNPAATGDTISSSNTPATAGTDGCSWSFCDRPTAEIHLVSAIGAGPCPGAGCTLTFDSPLTIAYRQSGSHNAQVYWPTDNTGAANPFATLVGLENLTIQRTTGGVIDMHFCAYCWVKNVEGVWWNHGFGVAYSVRSQLDTIYSHDCADSEFTGAEYPIDVTYASTEILVVNSITIECGKGMNIRSAGAGNVFAYNLIDQTYYLFITGAVSDQFVETTANASHAAGSHHTLLEGNQTPNMDADDTHGSVFYHTYFRNWATGFRSRFTDPSNSTVVDDVNNLSQIPPNGPLRTAGPMAYNYWFAYVGNVLGTSGQSTSGNGWVNFGVYTVNNKMIWFSGWFPNGAAGATDTHLNTMTSSDYILRDGNYDYRSGSVTWAGSAHPLPISLYLTGQTAPAFFAPGAVCTYPWPWVDPTGSQILSNSCGGSGLPAMARFNAGTPFVQP